MTQADSPPPVPVAIIGMGCLFPMAEDLERYWSNIRDRLDAVIDVPETHWRPEDYFDADPKAADRTYAHRGGFLSPVDFPLLDFGVSPNAVEATDTTQLLGLLVARKALEDAGYGAGGRDFARDRASVILGVTGTLELVIPLGARLGHPIWRRALAEAGVEAGTAEDVVRRISDSYVGWQEASFPGLLGNVAAGRIANKLDLGGSNCVVDAACASSLGAVNLALHELASGRCDVALSGGLDTFNDIFMYMCFSKTPALSPTGDARPFSADGDGTILGEGLGILVLKRLADAERDGDRIYAVIRSMGSSSDGGGQAIYAPKASGQVKALRRAYDQAGIAPETVGLIEAHGTGTRVGDGIEVEALEEVFRGAGAGARSCALGSVKSQIGHTKAAAGAAGLVKAALALHHKVLPPTIKVDRPVDRLAAEDSPFYVNTDNRPWLAPADHPRRAAVSAFGFGGSNFHCVLEEARPDRPGVDWGGDVQILAYSADDPKTLAAALPAWTEGTTWGELRAEAARSRSTFRADHAQRLLIVACRGETEPTALLAEAVERLAGPSARPSKRVFLGKGPAAGRLAFLFPGQGSQYVGMGRDLACRFPRMLSALELADRETAPALDGARLSERIFPAPSFTDEGRKQDDERLRDTRFAQPAIGAVSLGLLGILEDFGVRPDLTGGHSFGELSALHASGRVDAPSMLRLAAERGSLMGRRNGRDAGAMLAAFAPAARLEELIRQHALDVVVANKNAPLQCVLSGPVDEIARAETVLREARLSAKRLPVSAAFHSRFVADARQPFRDVLDVVTFGPTDVPTFANANGEAYPAPAEAARELLADQLAQPVEFTAMIQAMHRDGARLFVEVGPDAKLSGLVGSILDGRDHAAVATDSSRDAANGLVGLALALAAVAASGRPVDLALWDGDFVPAAAGKRPGLTVPVCGAHPAPKRKVEPPRPVAKAVAVAGPVETPAPLGHSPRSAVPSERPSPRDDAPAPKTRTSQPRPSFERTMNAPDRLPTASTNGNGHAHDHAAVPAAVAPRRPEPQPAPSVGLAAALQQTQDHLVALQQLAQQTARLHQQFLEGQETAQRTFQTLLEQRLHLAGAPATGQPVPSVAPTHATARAVEPIAIPAAPVVPPTPVAAPRPETPRLETRRVEPAPAAKPVPAPAPALATPVVAPGPDAGPALLAVVSEKTGYPVEMLELDMQLDADLGIDSIKRVEILSALQDRLPETPAIGPDQLGSIHTLRDIVALLGANAAATVAVTTTAPAAPVPSVVVEVAADAGVPASSARLERLSARARALVSPDRREVLAFAPGAEVWITNEDSTLTPAIKAELVGRGYRVRLIEWEETGEAVAAGVPDALIVAVPAVGFDSAALKRAFRLLRSVGPKLRRRSPSALLTISRLDGRFGLDGLDPSIDPVAGGLAGLAKTAGHEWPEVSCKAVDLACDYADVDAAARAIVEELLRRGPVEVGISSQGTREIVLERVEWTSGNHRRRPVLDRGDLVAITGGARGIAAEAAVALAKSYQPTLLLLGRTAAPIGPEPAWLARAEDEPAIRTALLRHTHEPTTPQKVNEQARLVLARREIEETLRRIREAGSEAIYESVDVRDRAAVRGVIERAEGRCGPVRGFVHAAGVLADRRIEDQTDAQFDMVYDTKVDGLASVFEALDPTALRAIAVFSSSTARFGRLGQVAYAAANEVLNKWSQVQARRLPDCRVVAFNWGPWDGGMVTPSLRAVFEREGLGLIPMAEGAELVALEIQESRENPVEVVVLADPPPSGPSPASTEAPGAYVEPPAAVDDFEPDLRPVFDRLIDVEAFPVLKSHVIDGHAVLPMALIMEWLCEAAVHRHPGLVVEGLDDLRLFKGVVLRDHRPAPVSLRAGKGEQRGGSLIVPVEMRGTLGEGREIVHARALVTLAERHGEGVRNLAEGPLSQMDEDRESIYERILFHGPAMQALERIEGCNDRAIAAWVATSPAPAEWIARPLRREWLTDPLAVDAAFQVMVLWCRRRSNANSLPTAVGSYRQFRRRFPSDGVRVVLSVRQASDHRAVADVEFQDADGELVARIDGYECVIDASLDQAFRKNRLAHPRAAANPR